MNQIDNSFGTPTEPQLSSSGLSEEDRAKLKKAQKRNVVIAIVLGLILAVMGFYAGKAAREHRAHAPICDVVVVGAMPAIGMGESDRI